MSTEKARIINETRVRDLLSQKDLTDPRNGVSPVNILLSQIEHNLGQTGLPVKTIRGNPIVLIEDSFDNLQFSQDSIMRSGLHTLSVDTQHVLRTQMSTTAVEFFKDNFDGKPGVFLFPGIVYRREGTHHQLDVWEVCRCAESQKTIQELVDLALRPCLVEGTEVRIGLKELCYILDGIKAKVKLGETWKTVVDGGQVVETVLQKIGINPNEFVVFAVGMGLDRLAMLNKKMDDPRLFRSTDSRVTSQMGDLRPYRQVSFMPPIVRDLSVPVSLDITSDDIDALVRTHAQEGIIESVEVVTDTTYEAVPDVAKKRLGIMPNEKNLLVRVRLRSFERTLRKEDANSIRQTLFEVLNHCNSRVVAELVNLPETR